MTWHSKICRLHLPRGGGKLDLRLRDPEYSTEPGGYQGLRLLLPLSNPATTDITAGGFLFGRQAILEYIFHQRKKETSLREAARSSAGGAQTAAVAVAQDQARGFLEEEAASMSRPFTSTAASGNGPDDA